MWIIDDDKHEEYSRTNGHPYSLLHFFYTLKKQAPAIGHNHQQLS